MFSFFFPAVYSLSPSFTGILSKNVSYWAFSFFIYQLLLARIFYTNNSLPVYKRKQEDNRLSHGFMFSSYHALNRQNFQLPVRQALDRSLYMLILVSVSIIKGAMTRAFYVLGTIFSQSKLGAFSYTQNGPRSPRRRHEMNS